MIFYFFLQVRLGPLSGAKTYIFLFFLYNTLQSLRQSYHLYRHWWMVMIDFEKYKKNSKTKRRRYRLKCPEKINLNMWDKKPMTNQRWAGITNFILTCSRTDHRPPSTLNIAAISQHPGRTGRPSPPLPWRLLGWWLIVWIAVGCLCTSSR